MSWGNSVILEADEKIVNSWKGIWITNDKTLSEKTSNQKTKEKLKERKRGHLVLTNHRLLFIDEEQTMLTIPLKKFVETWMDKIPIEIESPDNTETYVFQLSNVGKKEFEKIRELIISNCQRRGKIVNLNPEKQPPSVTMNAG